MGQASATAEVADVAAAGSGSGAGKRTRGKENTGGHLGLASSSDKRHFKGKKKSFGF